MILVGSDVIAEGELEVGPQQRVSDFMNQGIRVLSLRNATLTGEGTAGEPARVDHVIVPRSAVVLAIPVREDFILNDRVVPKEPHAVIVVAGRWRVEGRIHTVSGTSVSSALEGIRDGFLAVTAARVTGPGFTREAEVVLIGQQHVGVLVPVAAGPPNGPAEDATDPPPG